MAINPPAQRIWWNEPVHKLELLWVVIGLIWALVMFVMMPYWHITGNQNLSNEAYRINPEVFGEKTEAMTEAYKVREEGDTGIPVVHPPAGSDIYMLARRWDWWPILELEKDQTYRLHLSSMDWLHGFSLQPTNINLQIHPGYDMVVTITPNEAGVFSVVCNEFCGELHHNMVGRIHVVEK